MAADDVRIEVDNAELKSVREATREFGAMLEALDSGEAEKFVITRHGKMVAVLRPLAAEGGDAGDILGGGRHSFFGIDAAVPTRVQIEEGRPTKAQLAEWGVPWPPPRGWKRRLLAAADAVANRDGEADRG